MTGENWASTFELILVFGDFLEEFKTLFDEMLPDDLKTINLYNSAR